MFSSDTHELAAVNITLVLSTISGWHRRKAYIRGLLEKYPTFGREKETGLLGALDT
jgi:hypothetical protein